MKILVLNCGSSSIKYKLYDMTDESVLAQGGAERVGLDEAFVKVTLKDGSKEKNIPGQGTYTIASDGTVFVDCPSSKVIGFVSSIGTNGLPSVKVGVPFCG